MEFFFFFRRQLKQAEEIVKIRSQAAEGRWCLDKFHKSSIGSLNEICICGDICYWFKYLVNNNIFYV